jgi:hypothetical protein
MKITSLIIVMVSLLFLVGCFDYEETLEFKDDGSGTMIAHYELDNKNIDQMKKMYEEMAKMMPDADIPTNIDEMFFNKQKIEETLDSANNGIKLVSYETSVNDKSHVWDMKFSFEDINKSYMIYEAVAPDDEESYAVEEKDEEIPKLLTKQADGTLLFLRPFDDPAMGSETSDYESEDDYYYDDYSDEDSEYSDSDEDKSILEEEIEEGVNEMEKGLNEFAEGMLNHKIIFHVKFPGKIIESNAHSVDGNTATWEYGLEELDKSNIEQRAVIQP